MKKYGVKWPMQSSVVQEKSQMNFFLTHGVKSPCQLLENIEKSNKTKLERYGSETYNNADQIRTTKLERYGSETYNNQEKLKQTNIQRYGVENVYQSPLIIEKSNKTKLEKYSSETYNNREKAVETCLDKYGVHHHTQTAKARIENSERVKRQREKEPQLSCPKCGKTGHGPIMYRYHFSRCKI